jgi:protein-disulfide isomerase
MHDVLFERQSDWSGNADAVDEFKGMAAGLGLDQAQFDACLDEGTYTARVGEDYQEGGALGVTGTPAFRINGVALSGAQPYEAFQQQVDFLLAGGEPPTEEVAADSYRSMGSADAPVVVTEFSDYECPACASVESQVIPELIKRYVDTGKVRFVYREFPLSSIHPNAQKAAEAAVCAGEQDRYWEMHDRLFASQAEWSAEEDPSDNFKSYAEDAGLDADEFAQCLDSGEAAAVVLGEMQVGEAMGVNATPYFFVGDLPIRGGLPIDSLGRIIEYVAAGGSTPQVVPQDKDEWRVLGDLDTAQAVTVAIVDYASEDSAQHSQDVLPQLKDSYVDDGRMIYVVHPWSESTDSPSAVAARAAECAGMKGKYWEMNDRLFEEQTAWVENDDRAELFKTYAEDLGLEPADFGVCLVSDWAVERVESGAVVAALVNAPSAPVYLFNNGQGTQGSPPFEEFETIIESILSP